MLQSVDTVNKGEYIKLSIIDAISGHSNIDQTRIIKGVGLTMKILKTEDLSNSKLFYEGLTKINLPSFCDLIQNNNCLKTFENTTITVKLFQDLALIS
jgi:hypothetical protein